MKALVSAPMAAASKSPRVRMGEAIRLRLEGWMRTAADKHAVTLSNAVGRHVSLASAVRDLLASALRGEGPDAGYMSGFVQGFQSGYSDGKKEGSSRARGADRTEATSGPIRPQPSRDNGDYQADGEGES